MWHAWGDKIIVQSVSQEPKVQRQLEDLALHEKIKSKCLENVRKDCAQRTEGSGKTEPNGSVCATCVKLCR
jgi:hypothetical protein